MIENPDGTFSSKVDENDITDKTYNELLEEGYFSPDDEGYEDMEELEGDPFFSELEAQEPVLDPDVYASLPSSASFSPLPWQINLASNRGFGEHYIIYAIRRSSGSSYYWQYYAVLGKDIDYDNGIYTYSNSELYSYYTYNNTLYYDVGVVSGTVNGLSGLVYSDLFFDYVGVDPVQNAFPYITFIFFFLIFLALLIGGRKRV